MNTSDAGITPVVVIIAIIAFFAIVGVTILVAHLTFLRQVDRCMSKHEEHRADNPDNMNVNSEPGVPLIDV